MADAALTMLYNNATRQLGAKVEGMVDANTTIMVCVLRACVCVCGCVGVDEWVGEGSLCVICLQA